MPWKRLVFLALCAISPCLAKPSAEIPETVQCFFVAPTGWEVADPTSSSSHVKISFFKKSSQGFCPSINLAIEETAVSLNEYLKAVRAIHEQDRNKCWRVLGKVRTSAGLGQLTAIDTPSEFGPVRMLQLIVMKEGKAYIVTAAALKEEMPKYYKDFQSAFRSLTLTPDLLTAIPQLDRREALKEKLQQLLNSAQESDSALDEKQWLSFQTFLTDYFGDMGLFWQALYLKGAQEKLLSQRSETDRQNSSSEIQ